MYVSCFLPETFMAEVPMDKHVEILVDMRVDMHVHMYEPAIVS